MLPPGELLGRRSCNSVVLPSDLSLEDWYAGVYGLPTVWPEVSMMGADNLRKVAGYDFHHLRKKYDVRTMWEDLDPQWRLLQSQLETRGPGWYSPAELKERLFTNKSKRPGDDTKEALRTDGNTIAWQAWDTARNIIWQSCQPGPPLVFPGEKEIFRAMYAQIGEEEPVISPPYTRTPLDASMRGRKKRKQGEDNPGWGWIPPMSTYMRVLCHLWNYHGDTLKMEGCIACLTSFTPGSGGAWIDSVQALLLYLDDVLVGPRLARKAFQSSLILAVFSRYLTIAWVTLLMHFLATVGHKVSNYWKYGIY